MDRMMLITMRFRVVHFGTPSLFGSVGPLVQAASASWTKGDLVIPRCPERGSEIPVPVIQAASAPWFTGGRSDDQYLHDGQMN